jgi:hypothetical protein
MSAETDSIFSKQKTRNYSRKDHTLWLNNRFLFSLFIKEIRHMAEDNFTLTTFYTSWKAYQDHITGALAPLTAEQLELRAAPHLRSIGENALHIIGCRAFWFTDFLGEDCGEEMKVYAGWNEVALALGAPVPTVAELAQASTAPGNSWRIVWRAGVPPTCTRPFPTTGMARQSSCRAPGLSGM